MRQKDLGFLKVLLLRTAIKQREPQPRGAASARAAQGAADAGGSSSSHML